MTSEVDIAVSSILGDEGVSSSVGVLGSGGGNGQNIALSSAIDNLELLDDDDGEENSFRDTKLPLDASSNQNSVDMVFGQDELGDILEAAMGGGGEWEAVELPPSSPAEAVAYDIIRELIIEQCFKIHRMTKIGLFCLVEEPDPSADDFSLLTSDLAECQSSSSLARSSSRANRHSKVKKQALIGGRPVVQPVKIRDNPGMDVFGQTLTNAYAKSVRSYECVCPNCNRSMAAVRFAPHLEKCMGMGRNSSRVASRRLQQIMLPSGGEKSDRGTPNASRGSANSRNTRSAAGLDYSKMGDDSSDSDNVDDDPDYEFMCE